MSILRLLLVFLIASTASACGTPQPLLESANTTRGYLGTLRTQATKYIDATNTAADVRLQLLRDERARATRNESSIREQRAVATGGVKALVMLDAELRALAAERAGRDGKLDEALRTFEAELGDAKAKVGFPAKSFKKAEETLAQLSEDRSFAERAAFLLTYIRAVKAKYDAAKNGGSAPTENAEKPQGGEAATEAQP